jgi:hypothetical protein
LFQEFVCRTKIIRTCPPEDRIQPRAWLTEPEKEEEECTEAPQEACQLETRRACWSTQPSPVWIRPGSDGTTADLGEEETLADAAAAAAYEKPGVLETAASDGKAAAEEKAADERPAAEEKAAADAKTTAGETEPADKKPAADENVVTNEKAASDDKSALDGKADEKAAESRATFELFARSALVTENVSANPDYEVFEGSGTSSAQITPYLAASETSASENIEFPSDK